MNKNRKRPKPGRSSRLLRHVKNNGLLYTLLTTALLSVAAGVGATVWNRTSDWVDERTKRLNQVPAMQEQIWRLQVAVSNQWALERSDREMLQSQVNAVILRQSNRKDIYDGH